MTTEEKNALVRHIKSKNRYCISFISNILNRSKYKSLNNKKRYLCVLIRKMFFEITHIIFKSLLIYNFFANKIIMYYHFHTEKPSWSERNTSVNTCKECADNTNISYICNILYFLFTFR